MNIIKIINEILDKFPESVNTDVSVRGIYINGTPLKYRMPYLEFSFVSSLLNFDQIDVSKFEANKDISVFRNLVTVGTYEILEDLYDIYLYKETQVSEIRKCEAEHDVEWKLIRESSVNVYSSKKIDC